MFVVLCEPTSSRIASTECITLLVSSSVSIAKSERLALRKVVSASLAGDLVCTWTARWFMRAYCAIS